MAFEYNPANNAIGMEAGDTGNLNIGIEYGGLTGNDVVLFAVFDPDTGEDVLLKSVQINNGAAKIRICNKDTRDIEAGEYRWNLRIVTDPELSEDGSIRADDCDDDVITVFRPAPKFKIVAGGGRV